MSDVAPTQPSSRWMRWIGSGLSALPVLLLLSSGILKLSGRPPIVEAFLKLGYPEHLMRPIGILELACTVVYLVPQSSVLGAVLLTGYLGGATATHVRIGEPFFGPVIAGILIWLGLYFRDARLRAFVSPRT